MNTPPYTATYGDITEQQYSDSGANCPLAAQSETTSLTFSCPYAVLKITATSDVEKTISSVIVKVGDTHLSTLTCGDGGVVLSSTGTVFYITVKTGTLSSLNITFTDSSGYTATKTRSSDLTLGPGDLLPLTLNFEEGQLDRTSLHCCRNNDYYGTR